ncbi:MAG: hypothetical protein MUF54_08580 [Polyangiaceae bacterium]|jgi:hypothetical protein|nr:hypothetical protein [Polyangiaceae bacterium]
MLHPFIIEQLRRREQHRRSERPQPQAEIPADFPVPSRDSAPPEERGIVIIPLWD